MIKWAGTKYGRPAEGTIQDGACHGSFEVVSEVEALVAAGTLVGIGPVTGPADLTDPLLARAALQGVLDAGSATFEGDPVPVHKLPEDAES